jgi:hypothetical protein
MQQLGSLFSQEEGSPFSGEEQSRLRQQAGMLQLGLESLNQRLDMIHKVRY